MPGLDDIDHAVSGDFLGLAVKLVAAALAGLVLGLDRELKGHAAGLRTHMLVALAGAATAALALELHDELLRRHPNSNADPLRIIEGVVAAVGFLGGGIIIRAGGQIRGVTTAANLWICGSVGLAFGAGLWRIALITLGLAFIILVVLQVVERRWLPTPDEDERNRP